MSKTIKQLFFILTAIVCFSFAPSDVSPYPFTKSSLLWKIEGPGIIGGSYLFGTMHIIEKDYFVFPDKLEKIVSKTDRLIMEIAGIPTQSEAMKMVILQEGTFFDFFNSEQTDSILNWAKAEMKMDETVFRASMSKMKPFVVIQMATQLQFMGKTESYEISFQEIAVKNKIEIKGLETLEQQMALFDNLTKEEQAEMVMAGIRDPKKGLTLLKEMQQVYQRQNIDSLYMLVLEDEASAVANKQASFLDNRNINWIGQIKKHLQEKKCFIAVGAGHLGGPNGVIRLLEKEGYKLTPVELN